MSREFPKSLRLAILQPVMSAEDIKKTQAFFSAHFSTICFDWLGCGSLFEVVTAMRSGQADLGLCLDFDDLKSMAQDVTILAFIDQCDPSITVFDLCDKESGISVFKSVDARRQYGRVTLVGAGPGDPELITVKGVAALKQADCVFYDFLAHPDLLRYAQQADIFYVGKRKGHASISQQDICRQLREKAQAGQSVVRLKGGDPLVFARTMDEIYYLQKYHIETEIIPGISSAIGVASKMGLSLTARGQASSVSFISAHLASDKSAVKANSAIQVPNADTLVYFMGLTRLKEIVAAVKAAGRDDNTQVMVVSKGCSESQKVIRGDLRTIIPKLDQAALEPPTLIMVGGTINHWQPLLRRRRTWLYTGQNADQYRQLGDVMAWPLLEAKRLDKGKLTRRPVQYQQAKNIIILNAYAVKHLFDLAENESWLDQLQDRCFFAVGDVSAEALKKRGAKNIIVADRHSAPGLYQTICAAGLPQSEIFLWPCAISAHDFIKDRLQTDGYQVHRWPIYELCPSVFRPLPKEEDIDGVIFTSPAMVDCFFEQYKTIPYSWQVLVRGTLTAERLRQRGVAYPRYVFEELSSVSMYSVL